MNHIDAVKLFCINVFKSNYIKSGYEELMKGVLSHVEGHPLAIDRSNGLNIVWWKCLTVEKCIG